MWHIIHYWSWTDQMKLSLLLMFIFAFLTVKGSNFAELTYHISLVIRQSYFSFPNNPKNLDPSFKMDLDLWDCLGRVKPELWQNFIGLI